MLPSKVKVPVFILPNLVKPVTPAEGLPSPISVTSIVPLPSVAFTSRVARAVVPPTTPCIATAPVPEEISKSTAPSIVELIVTPPAVEPVSRETAPVPSVSASEIVIVPPAP